MTDEEFLDLFEAGAPPHEQWDHRAHLRMAYLVLRDSIDDKEALERMRTGITRLNAAHDAGGHYCDKVTRFWLEVVHDAMDSSIQDAPFEEFIEKNRALLDKRLILERHARDELERD